MRKIVASAIALALLGATVVGCNESGGRVIVLKPSSPRPGGGGATNQAGATLALTAPTDGDRVAQGQPVTITWTASGVEERVWVSVSTDAGATYTELARVRAQDEKYVWQPGSGLTAARVKVETDSGALVSANASDFTFHRVWFVDPAAAGTRDGTSWRKAVERIQTAVDLAGTGDLVWVANTSPQVAFNSSDEAVVVLTAGETLGGVYGGFAGGESSLSQRPQPKGGTTIDGQSARSGVYVPRGAGLEVLDGFTFVGGAGVSGGGVHVSQGAAGDTITITRCVFDGNAATHWGGGLAVLRRAATVTDCEFKNNTAVLGGGGAYVDRTTSEALEVSKSTFTSNRATDPSGNGGGLAVASTSTTFTVSECTFTKNEAEQYGGGLYLLQGNATVASCEFRENSGGAAGGGATQLLGQLTCSGSTFAENTTLGVPPGGFPSGDGPRLVFGGGGLFLVSNSGARVETTSFMKNTSTNGGGLLAKGTQIEVLNSAFVENDASYMGGGLFSGASSAITLRFSTLTLNLANGVPPAPYVNGAGFGSMAGGSGNAVDSSILHGNLSSQLGSFDASSPATVSFSDVQGGVAGAGNIDADPQLTNPANGDLTPAAGSPVLDAANTAGPPATDLNGNARDPANPDMGAVER